MALIEKLWLDTDAIDGQIVSNDTYIKGRNAADNADVNMLKVNASDALEFGSVPQVTADPTVDNALTRKSWVDTQLGNYQATSEKGSASGYASLDADGLVPIGQMPAASLERLSIVADEAARFALTTAVVQDGDTVKQTDTGILYFVSDDSNLDSAAGYTEYTAGTASSISWSGVTSTPTTLAGYGITDAEAKNANIQTHIGTVTGNPHAVTKAEVGLTNVTDVAQMPASYLDTDNTLAADSDVKVPSQKAIKAYVATQIGTVNSAEADDHIQTLDATDISNGYFDIGFEALAGSIKCWPVGGPLQTFGVDYTVSYAGGAGGVTRITLAGDMSAKLVAGKQVIVNYLKA